MGQFEKTTKNANYIHNYIQTVFSISALSLLVYFDALAGACISKGKGGGGIDGVLGLVPSAEQEKKGISIAVLQFFYLT